MDPYDDDDDEQDWLDAQDHNQWLYEDAQDHNQWLYEEDHNQWFAQDQNEDMLIKAILTRDIVQVTNLSNACIVTINVINNAMELGNVDIVLCLLTVFLESGGNINIPTLKGNTFLHIAVKYGRRKIVKELVKMGADSNARNNKGETPLHLACHYTNWSVVRYLLAQGSDMLAVDNDGQTCLHHVAFNFSYTYKTARKLLFRGLDVRKKDVNGMTPLNIAVQRGIPLDDMIRLFLKYGANVNEQDNEGRTPFHYTLIHIQAVNSIANLQVLLENGADLTITDNRGDSCMSIAMSQSHNVLQEILSHLKIRDESYYALVGCEYLQELRLLHMLDCDSIADLRDFTGPLVKRRIQVDDW